MPTSRVFLSFLNESGSKTKGMMASCGHSHPGLAREARHVAEQVWMTGGFVAGTPYVSLSLTHTYIEEDAGMWLFA